MSFLTFSKTYVYLAAPKLAKTLIVAYSPLPPPPSQTVGGAVSRVLASVDSYISHLDVQVSSQVARCQPLWAIYTELHNSVCFVFQDGLVRVCAGYCIISHLCLCSLSCMYVLPFSSLCWDVFPCTIRLVHLSVQCNSIIMCNILIRLCQL